MKSKFSEKKLMDALMENIPDRIYFKDRQCRLIRINRKMMRDLRLDEMNQVIGKTDVDLFGEEFGHKTSVDDQQVMTTGEPLVGLIESKVFPDGQVNWTSTTKVPLRDARGQIVGLVGISREINELMRAEKALRESELLYRTTIDAMSDLIHVIDTNLRIVIINTAYTQILKELGMETDMFGRTVFEAFPFLPDHVRDEYRWVFEHGKTLITEECTTIKGREYLTETRKIPVFDGEKVVRIATIVRDITERKHAEEELRKHRDHLQELVKARTVELTKVNEQLLQEIAEREQIEKTLLEERNLLRTLIDQLPDYIYVKDRESRFLLMNTTSLHGLGVTTQEEIVGKSDFDFSPPQLAAQYYADEQTIMTTGQSLLNQEEIYILPATGASIWISSSKVPFRDRQGNIAGLVGIGRNITERKQVEEELRRHRDHLEELVKERTAELTELNDELRQEIAERERTEQELHKAKELAEAASRGKSVFLANMSHELRTPLNAILGYTQLLKDDQSLLPKHREHIGVIHRSGEHLLTMINDILDLSQIDAGKMELARSELQLPLFLKHIAEFFHFQAQQKGIDFSYHIAPDVPLFVYGDEKRLRQVLLNLLSNAMKFTEKGSVALKIGYHDARREKCKIRFLVEDTGIGIAPEQLYDIFLPFYRLNHARVHTEGVGLGLAISQKLVTMMGGEISVESRVDQGSIFWFDLDLPKVAGRSVTVKVEHPIIIGFKGGTRKILVVDDIDQNRIVFQKMLSPLGFEVLEAMDGYDAITKAIEFRPDVILMDLLMFSMDGFEAARSIRQIPALKDVIVIGVSASAFEHTRQQSLAAGCHDFITKPVQLAELLEKLRVHLHLEWRYTEVGTIQRNQSDDDQENYPATHLPPAEEIQHLFELATSGDLKALLQQLDRIEHHSAEFSRFTAKIREFARSFQINRMCEFLGKCLREK